MPLLLKDPDDFLKVFLQLRSAVLVSSRMPAKVFRPGYGNYRLLDFDLFSSTEFGGMLKILVEHSNDQKLHLVVVDPDPRDYFFTNFGHFGALEISRDDAAVQYCFELESSPPNSPADSLKEIAALLVWAPPSLRWLIWAERNPEMMILAYQGEFAGPSADVLALSGMTLFSAEDALDTSAPAWRDRSARDSFARELLANYSAGQPWQDPAVIRALRVARQLIAGSIGTIEACRELSSLRYSLGDDLESIFLTFAAIDSETDHLPVGRCRSEWNPDALALKDLEITRAEELYSEKAREACYELIDHLRPLADS